MNIGLLSVTASVYQMMRGAEMLFAALFAVSFLKRHLNRYHYMGLLCCTVRRAAGVSCAGRVTHTACVRMHDARGGSGAHACMTCGARQLTAAAPTKHQAAVVTRHAHTCTHTHTRTRTYTHVRAHAHRAALPWWACPA
jgi:hypothetical protein